MDNIDGIITKDEVYRLFSDFRAYIPAAREFMEVTSDAEIR